MDKETILISTTLNEICNNIKGIINSGEINDIENIQKLYSILSFLEFGLAGANIRPLTNENNKIIYIIDLK